jgi:endonuclease G
MNQKSYMLVAVAILIATVSCVREVGSQPATPAPPEIQCKHFIYGYPAGAPASNDLIIRDLYALSNNDSTKFADWVCTYLTCHEVDGDLDLERAWRNDPWLDPSETLEAKPTSQDDYRGQKEYDRGHLAPLASFKGSRFASQVNYYSNIVPERPELNRGPWVGLESKTPDLVRKYGSAWVMCDPLYETLTPPLPNYDEPHRVPSRFWKIIASRTVGSCMWPRSSWDRIPPGHRICSLRTWRRRASGTRMIWAKWRTSMHSGTRRERG